MADAAKKLQFVVNKTQSFAVEVDADSTTAPDDALAAFQNGQGKAINLQLSVQPRQLASPAGTPGAAGRPAGGGMMMVRNQPGAAGAA